VNWQQRFVVAALSELQAAQNGESGLAGVVIGLLGFAPLVAQKSMETLPQ
jgi:hypothetical protein